MTCEVSNFPARVPGLFLSCCALISIMLLGVPAKVIAQDDSGDARTASEMKVYSQKIRNTEISFSMVPIPGGEFLMGSPAGEVGRLDDEGPQHKVKLEPFWMGKTEVTWDEFELWSIRLERALRDFNGAQAGRGK